jgi:hypothetical protein
LRTYDYVFLGAATLFAALILLFVSQIFREDPGRQPTPTVGEVPGSRGEMPRPGAALPPTPLARMPGPPAAPAARPGAVPAAGREGEPGQKLPSGTSRIGLRIRDVKDAPLPGVAVSLLSGSAGEQIVTGARGHALFADRAAGAYAYRLEAPGRPPLSSARSIELREGEEQVVTLKLEGYDLSIAGRVLNQAGEPLAGVEVVATRHDRGASDGPLVPLRPRELRTRTANNGGYVIRGLREGEYELKIEATDRYGSVRKKVRAGVDSADLVLVEGRPIRVYGSVTGPRGESLSGVQVVPGGDTSRATYTDDAGSYELEVSLPQSAQAYRFRFILSGHREEHVEVRADEVSEAELRFDVQLQRAGETTVVSGVLATEEGAPIRGEKVNLGSKTLRTRYEAVSDAGGRFSLRDVELGSDYELSVRPKGMYRDYSERRLEVTRDFPVLEIVLEGLATSRLRGRMIDADGRPVPGFPMWLWSAEARARAVEIKGDHEGRFVVDQAPVGRLMFETRSLPQLRVYGGELLSGVEKEVVLVLDWGTHVLTGRVSDERGSPVPGAQVHVTWSQRDQATRSSSYRQAVTDDAGSFKLTQLGSGLHRMRISGPGYKSVDTSYDVGKDSGLLEVQLKALPQ